MTAPERLHELAERHVLGSGARTRLAALLELLASDAMAPSAVTATAAAVDIHVADSLTALDVPAISAARRIADIGSGAGFPGLVLAIALPEADVALVESNRRKCDFLERARAASGTSNATVVCARAEAWPAGLGGHDVVTARAVGSLALLCEYAAPLLALGGTLVAWKGAAPAFRVAPALRVSTRSGAVRDGSRARRRTVCAKAESSPGDRRATSRTHQAGRTDPGHPGRVASAR